MPKMTTEQPTLMVTAESTLCDLTEPACLGMRFGHSRDIAQLKRLLMKQIRSRYSDIFDGMKPREIEEKVIFRVYLVDPKRRYGWPQLWGYASDWE